MNAFNLHPIQTEGFIEIQRFFEFTHPPDSLRDIHTFNKPYQRIYPLLRAAERLVDEMISHLVNPDWAKKIYGLV